MRTIQKLNLITINNDQFLAMVGSKTLGDLGEATLILDPAVNPKALPCPKLPLAVQDDVKREIDILVERGCNEPCHEEVRVYFPGESSSVLKMGLRYRM